MQRHALIVATERETLDDALGTTNLETSETSDSSDEERLVVDGREDTTWTGRAGATS